MEFYHLCDVCNVPLYTVTAFNDHYVSKAHKKKRILSGHGPIGLQAYVRGYPTNLTRPSDLFFLFSKYGIVKDVHLSNSTFAFVTFDEPSHAENAIKSSPIWLGQSKLTVCPVINKEPPPPPEPWQLLYKPTPQLLEASIPESKLENMLNECPSVEDQMEKFVKWAELLPAEKNARLRFLQLLSSGLHLYFPNPTINVYGSSSNGFVLRGSDMDVSISLDNGDRTKPKNKLIIEDLETSYESHLSYLQMINSGKNVDKSLMAQLVHEPCFIQLKVLRKVIKCHVPGAQYPLLIPSRNAPILRLNFEGMFTCDLKSTPGYEMENTALLRFYGKLDPRVKPLILTLRFWARRNELVSSNTLSSYALTFLAIFFLQNTTPPIVPSVLQLREPLGPNSEKIVKGWDCSFCDDLKKFPPSSNSQTTGELLCQFFEFYTNFKFTEYVVSPYRGKAIPIQEYLYDPDMKSFHEAILCLQDPFELTRNLTARCHARYITQLQTHLNLASDLCRSAAFSTPKRDEKSHWGLSLLFQLKEPKITYKVACMIKQSTKVYPLVCSVYPLVSSSIDNAFSLSILACSIFLDFLKKVLLGECTISGDSFVDVQNLFKNVNKQISSQDNEKALDSSNLEKKERSSKQLCPENLEDDKKKNTGEGKKRSYNSAELEGEERPSKRMSLENGEIPISCSLSSRLSQLKGNKNNDPIQTIICKLYYPLWVKRPKGELDDDNESFLSLWETTSLQMLQDFGDKPKYPLGQVKFQLVRVISPLPEIKLTMCANRCLVDNDDLFQFVDTYVSYLFKNLPS